MTPPSSRPRAALYLVLMGVTALSAVLGFAREATIGAFFGASRSTDAFYSALALPFIAAYFLVGGAVAPPLTAAMARRLEEGDREGARRLLGASVRSVLLAGLPVVLILALVADVLVPLYVPGFGAEHRALTAVLLRLLLAYGLLTSLGQLGMAALTAAGAYRTPAVAVLLGNATALAVLAGFGRGASISAAAWALDAGSLVFLAALVPRLVSLDLLPARPRGLALPWRESALLAVSLAAAGAVDFCERPFASTAGVGAVAILAFASKLIHLPMRLVAAPLASVSFPRLVRSRLRGGSAEAGETADRIARLLAYAAAVTAGAAGPIAALTFGRGRFDAHAVAALAGALALLSPAVVAIGIIEVASKYLVAAGRTRSVVIAQVAGLVAYLVAAPLLRGRGVPGLAVARDVAWCIAAAGLVLPLVAYERGLRLFRRPGRLLAATSLAAVAAGLATRELSGGNLLICAAAALLAGAVFGGVLLVPSARVAAEPETS